MLNPNAWEAVHCAAYIDDYIDSVKYLPDDVQRQLLRVREIGVQVYNNLRNVDYFYDFCKTLVISDDPTDKRRAQAIARMKQSLIVAQELVDEKIDIIHEIKELIHNKRHQLNSGLKKMDIKDNQRQNDVQYLKTKRLNDAENTFKE